MIEDKLNPAQRIRLESLSQAVQITLATGFGNVMSAIREGEGGAAPFASAELVIETARRFEKWISGEPPAAGYGWLTSPVLVETIHAELERIERAPVAKALAERVALAIATQANDSRPFTT